MGLDIWLYQHEEHPIHKKTIEINSRIDPKHTFKIGYFRSSHNNHGINRVLLNTIGEDLNSIFGVETNSSCDFQPNWDTAYAKVKHVIMKFQRFVSEGGVGVMKAGVNVFTNLRDYPTTKQAALKIFIDERRQHNECGLRHDRPPYRNSKGEFFFGGPLKVLAVIPGVDEGCIQSLDGKTPLCQFLVYEADDLDWYLTALRIVQETIEWVLGNPNREKFYLHWGL